jgi:hypothetical protein
MQHGRHGGAGATATQQRPAGGGGGCVPTKDAGPCGSKEALTARAPTASLQHAADHTAAPATPAIRPGDAATARETPGVKLGDTCKAC